MRIERLQRNQRVQVKIAKLLLDRAFWKSVGIRGQGSKAAAGWDAGELQQQAYLNHLETWRNLELLKEVVKRYVERKLRYAEYRSRVHKGDNDQKLRRKSTRLDFTRWYVYQMIRKAIHQLGDIYMTKFPFRFKYLYFVSPQIAASIPSSYIYRYYDSLEVNINSIDLNRIGCDVEVEKVDDKHIRLRNCYAVYGFRMLSLDEIWEIEREEFENSLEDDRAELLHRLVELKSDILTVIRRVVEQELGTGKTSIVRLIFDSMLEGRERKTVIGMLVERYSLSKRKAGRVWDRSRSKVYEYLWLKDIYTPEKVIYKPDKLTKYLIRDVERRAKQAKRVWMNQD